MSSTDGRRSHRFPPGGERTGFLLGHSVGTLVGATIVLFGVPRALNGAGGGLAGLAAAVVWVTVGALILLRRAWGLTLLEWTPVASRHARAAATGSLKWTAGAIHARRITTVPRDGDVAPQPAVLARPLPAELAGIELFEVTLSRIAGRPRLGVAYDGARGCYVAAVFCESRAFELLDPEDQELMLDAHGSFIAAFGRDAAACNTIQWGVRSLPSGLAAAREYAHAHRRDGMTADDVSDLAMRELLDDDTAGNEAETWLAILVDTHTLTGRRLVRQHGGGRQGALAVVADEMTRVVGELARIGAHDDADGRLIPDGRGLAAMLQDGLDPYGRREREQPVMNALPGVAMDEWGPAGRLAGWGHVTFDGSLSCTLEVAGMPEHDVRGTFLARLLTGWGVGCCSFHMRVLSRDEADRVAAREKQKAHAERGLRARLGLMASARKERQEGSTWTLAEQLADGHALVRYGGVVTVAVPYERGPVGLREAVGRAQDRAHDAGVRLRPVWGDQAAAATLSLPLCRGWK